MPYVHNGPPDTHDDAASLRGTRTWFHAGGHIGPWRVTRIVGVKGETVAHADFLTKSHDPLHAGASWSLSGTASSLRYTTADERAQLIAANEGADDICRDCAVLIPIRKSERWWALAQDERRDIYARSHHMEIGLDYLPAIARQLFHCRDLGGDFDFLTWFEFSKVAEPAFSALLERLRATPEWAFVAHETEIWLAKAD
ncbi:MAG: hypothetical protein RLZZ58_2195 [Pseudomonadota bacterium]